MVSKRMIDKGVEHRHGGSVCCGWDCTSLGIEAAVVSLFGRAGCPLWSGHMSAGECWGARIRGDWRKEGGTGGSGVRV